MNGTANLSSLLKITSKLASRSLFNGKVLTSAIYHLSINDIESSIMKLIRGDEMEFAYILSEFYENEFRSYLFKKILITTLGRKWFKPETAETEKNDNSKERIRFLKKFLLHFKTKNNEERIGLLGLIEIEDSEVENIYLENSMKKFSEYKKIGDEGKIAGNIKKSIFYYNLARNYEDCFLFAAEYAKSNFLSLFYKKIKSAKIILKRK